MGAWWMVRFTLNVAHMLLQHERRQIDSLTSILCATSCPTISRTDTNTYLSPYLLLRCPISMWLGPWMAHGCHESFKHFHSISFLACIDRPWYTNWACLLFLAFWSYLGILYTDTLFDISHVTFILFFRCQDPNAHFTVSEYHYHP